VNRLLKQFADAQKMMKQLAGGRGLPAMPGLAAAGKKRKR
jgi:signal recognition particle GTPase